MTAGPVSTDPAPAEISPSDWHEPASIKRPTVAWAAAFVWACWVVGFVSAAVVVLLNARDVPLYEDWQLVPALTGHQPHLLAWLWSQDNENRAPLARLVYLGLLKLWPDFRVGMVLNILLLTAISAAFIIFVRRVRGHTRWTDAFFPVAFLNLGNWANMGFSWQLMWVLAVGLECGLLLAVAARGPITTRRAWGLGGCLVAIPLTGATALPFAPVMSLALLTRLRSASRRVRAVLLSGILLSLGLMVAYFIGFERTLRPPSPGLWATAETSLKFLAMGLGPAAGAWWFGSSLIVLILLAGALFVLWRSKRENATLLLVFMAAGLALAIAVGNSRAGDLGWWGMLDYYTIAALPMLCCAYLAYDRYGARLWRRLGPATLFVIVIALVPLNILFGLQYRDWYHRVVDTFAQDVKAGKPVGELGYDWLFGASPAASLVYLHQAHLGVFGRLRLAPYASPPAGPRVDGFDTEAKGWATMGGPSSTAALRQSGAQLQLQWNYNVGTGTVPVLGRSLPAPEDWRGNSAIAITVAGQGTGRYVTVRIVARSDRKALVEYDTSFTDYRTGLYTVVIPWDGFRHVNSRGELDLEGPVPERNIVSLLFTVSGAPGPGTLVIKRLGLVPGHGELIWPYSSAAGRRSLPPWP